MEQQSFNPMASLLLSKRARQQLSIQGLYSNGGVQDWLSPAGQRRSMPTNCLDDATLINNNTLRSSRGYGTSRYAVANCNPASGSQFSACTLVDNWSEDQTGTWYAPVTQYRLQPKQNQTEYRAEMSTRSADRLKQARVKQLQKAYLAGGTSRRSRPVSAGAAFNISRTSTKASSSLLDAAIHEARCAEHLSSSSNTSTGSSWQDCPASTLQQQLQRNSSSLHSRSNELSSSGRPHSTPGWHSGNEAAARHTTTILTTTDASSLVASTGRRCWSAAAGSRESIAATAGRHHKLEFQKPAVGDARARVLGLSLSSKDRDASLAKTCRERLESNKAVTRHWASTYEKDYLRRQWVEDFEKSQRQSFVDKAAYSAATTRV